MKRLLSIFALIGSLALAGVFTFGPTEAEAQNANCNVTNVDFRTNPNVVANPNGDDDGDGKSNFQEHYFLDYNRPYFYLDFQTSGCVDNDGNYDIVVDLVSRLGVVNGHLIEEYSVDTDNFTLAYFAGEECDDPLDPDCLISVTTTDGNSTDNWPDSLGYDCHGDCDFDTQVFSFLGTVSFLGSHENDEPGVNPGAPGGQATISSEAYLAPLPGLAGQEAGLQGFLQGLFNVLIVIAGISALLMIVIGAIHYVSADSLGGTETGRKMIGAAVMGLVIALAGWVLINTINPNLASNLMIKIPKATLDEASPQWQNGEAPTNTVITGSGNTLNGQPITQGMSWPSDAAQRQQLASAGITVNTPNNCTPTAGGSGCTSLYFEGDAAQVINDLIELKNLCSCEMVVTGGSEAWLHHTHGPTKKVIDLRATESLNAYLRGLPGGPGPGNEFPTGKKITVGGVGRFYAEPSGATGNTTSQHWHVNFY